MGSIRFRPLNSAIMTTRANMLGGPQRQLRAALVVASIKMPCPCCGHRQNYFEVAGIDIDDYAGGPGHAGTCKKCGVWIEPFYHFPMASETEVWSWQRVSTGLPQVEAHAPTSETPEPPPSACLPRSGAA